MKLFLFDMDGTLAESGQKITQEIKNILEKLKNNGDEIGIVGGGRYEKIVDQLDNFKVNHIFSESGCVYHRDKEIYRKNIRTHKLYPQINKIIKLVLKFLSEVDYELTGHFVDLRSGIIYVSLIGMTATQEERQIFMNLDKTNNYRHRLIKLLKEKAIELNIENDLDILEGGSVGIGIYPKEWDKTQVLEVLDDKYSEILYFGDKYTPEGNDYRLLHNSKVKGIPVDSFTDTLKYLENLLFI